MTEKHTFEVGLQFYQLITKTTLVLFKLIRILFYLSFSYY